MEAEGNHFNLSVDSFIDYLLDSLEDMIIAQNLP